MSEIDVEPLVSIITVTYNAESLLEETMQSVFNQTYRKIEYILIDGLSSDGTLDIIRRHKDRISLWKSEKDHGIYDAMNKGISLAKGELIGMINAGDTYEKDAVESVVEAYLAHPDCGIFHGNMNYLDAAGNLIKTKYPEIHLENLYKGMSLHHPTFFVTKNIYATNGLYDTNYKVSADFDFALRNYIKGTRFFYINKVISNFRLGGFSMNNNIKGMYESRDILLNNGYSKYIVDTQMKYWRKRAFRKRVLESGHSILKRILPKKILNKLSDKIK